MIKLTVPLTWPETVSRYVTEKSSKLFTLEEEAVEKETSRKDILPSNCNKLKKKKMLIDDMMQSTKMSETSGP